MRGAPAQAGREGRDPDGGARPVRLANCGLPYHVSGVIPEESSLLVATEQMFRAVFNVEVRTGCEAVSISPKEKTVNLRDVATGKVTTEPYDKLVLSPGAAPIRPPLPGIDLPGIFSVRTSSEPSAAWRNPATPSASWRFTPCLTR